MCVADMAAIEKITEDNIIEQLEARYRKNDTYTFIGDVLLFLNPNKSLDIYGYQVNMFSYESGWYFLNQIKL